MADEVRQFIELVSFNVASPDEQEWEKLHRLKPDERAMKFKEMLLYANKDQLANCLAWELVEVHELKKQLRAHENLADLYEELAARFKEELASHVQDNVRLRLARMKQKLDRLKGGQRRWANDPVKLIEPEIRGMWDAWQEEPAKHKTATAFYKSVMERYLCIVDVKALQRRHAKWKKEVAGRGK